MIRIASNGVWGLCQRLMPLLAFIAKYDVPTNQWTWLYEALLEVSMTKIALWIRVYVDDWTAESAVKASKVAPRHLFELTGLTGCPPPPPPPNTHTHGPKFLSFMQFFENFGKFLCWRPRWRVGAPSYRNPGSVACFVPFNGSAELYNLERGKKTILNL